MHELAPHHVPRLAILIPIAFADARLHFGFHVAHGRVDRLSESIENPLILRRGIEYGNGLWHVKVEIVSGGPIAFDALQQFLASFRIQSIAEGVPVRPGDFA